MKKSLLGIVALLSMQHAVAQEAAQPQDPAFKEVFAEVTAQRPQKKSWAEKLKIFNKAVDYLEGARNCLSGRECSKKQAYRANFALGATIGLGRQLALVGFRVKVNKKVSLLQLISYELGYRYFVKEKVQLFRCLTFRGCSDQTKRYLMFYLGDTVGVISGNILAMIVMPKRHKQFMRKAAGLDQAPEEAAGPPVVESVPVEVEEVSAEPVGRQGGVATAGYQDPD